MSSEKNSNAPQAVGVIGLGSMGGGMALALVRAGFTVTGNDVSPARIAAARSGGVRIVDDAAGVGAAATVVVISVVNAAQTDAALFGERGAIETLVPGAVVVATSTVAAAYVRDLERRLRERGVLLLDAPVSGGSARAYAGQLSIMASGAPAAFDRANGVLEAMATTVYRLGDEAGMGSSVKMINQLLAGVHIAAACEAMALGMKAGIDPQRLFDVISNSAGSSWMFANRVPHILAGDYTSHSAVNIFVKDLGLVLDGGRELRFPLPLAASAHQLFLAAAAMGLGDEDDASVVKVFARLADLTLPQPPGEA